MKIKIETYSAYKYDRIAKEYEKVYWHGLWKRRKGTK